MDERTVTADAPRDLLFEEVERALHPLSALHGWTNDGLRELIRQLVQRVRTAEADTARLREALGKLRDAAMMLVTTTGEFDTIHSTFTIPTEFLDNLRDPLNVAADALRVRPGEPQP